jgi:hypothetical protein
MNDIVNLYICSAGHSGSTLLDMFLGTHPDCESLGELSILPMDFAMNRICACRTEMRQCPLWSQVASRLGIDVENDPYSLNLGFLRPTVGDPRKTNPWTVASTRLLIAVKYYQLLFRMDWLKPLVRSLDEGVQNTLKVYDIIRELTGKRVLVDSSKHHTKAVSLYQADPAKTRILLLVRDGRGVFYSNVKRGFGRRYSLNAWLKHYAHTFNLISRLVDPAHVVRVRYEDLIINTEKTLRDICEFVNLKFDPKMFDVNTVVHHNVNGNDMKFRPVSELRLDEGWKSGLSEADMIYFDRYAGWLNRSLGYI